MKAYTGIITKDEFIKELEAHRAADNFISGTYWEGGIKKGCAVGCSLESIARLKKLEISFSDHSKYPELLGIPEWLARIEDSIFENLPFERSKNWPVEFSQTINVGADLDVIKGPFLICALKRALTTFDNEKFCKVTASINTVIKLWEKGGSLEEFESAAETAESVARAAEAAAEAWSVARAAEAAAWSVARAVARAAEAAAEAWSVARAAEAAAEAWSVARAAEAAAAAAAWAAARAETYEYFADQLLELIRNVKGELAC